MPLPGDTNDNSDTIDLIEPEFVVGVGASAGGLEALENFFDAVTPSARKSFVVVTHLSPDFRSLLDELLARRTDMPVRLVEDGDRIVADRVYVLPPTKDMIVVGARLFLRDREKDDAPPAPIDTFFRSLAREWGERSVAIVLSGTGSDGSRGVADVKEAGGVVLAQEPATARFGGMPGAAIATGHVDRILPPWDMGPVLNAISKTGALEPVRASTTAVSIGEAAETTAMSRIILKVFGVSDIDFSCYKTSTFRRRVERRMAATKIATVVAYADRILNDDNEAQRLSEELLIGVTEFFRDPVAFQLLESRVLEAKLVECEKERKPLRIWIAGCATGQEAYTVAILTHEMGKRLGLQVALQIFATDVRESYLEQASRGVYSEPELSTLSPSQVSEYFVPTSGGYKVIPSIRNAIVFARHNLIGDPPFTRVDLICCRNVLIYFDIEAQQQIFSLFHFALNSDGALFLGPSESLGDSEHDFSVVDARWRLFRKAHDRPLHRGPTTLRLAGERMPKKAGAAHRSVARRKEAALLPAYGALLDRFAPPSVLISNDRELLHTFAGARRFLRPPIGVTSLDVIGMVDSALRTPITAGIERSVRERQEITFPALPLRDDPHLGAVGLTIMPIGDVSDDAVDYVLIIFHEENRAPSSAGGDVVTVDIESISNDRVEALEVEIKRARETLQATIEEVETSNEELQSTNEELMAANEELQSTNEELNSVNEELYSVNAQYQRQNEELVSLNADMESLLHATEIGILFIDENLEIRRATASASGFFNIIPADIGRRVGHLTHRFAELDIEKVISDAVSIQAPIERELVTHYGDWWLLRAIPHRFANTSRHGSVVTFVNINRIKRVEMELMGKRRRLERMAEITRAIFLELSPAGDIKNMQSEFEDATGAEFEEYAGGGWWSYIHPDDRNRVRAEFDAAVALREAKETRFRLRVAEPDGWRHFRADFQPGLDAEDQDDRWLGVLIDIEDAVQADEVVRASEELLRIVSKSSSSLSCYINLDFRLMFVNDRFAEYFECAPSAAVGAKLSEVIPDALHQKILPYLQQALKGERNQVMIETNGSAEKRVSWSFAFMPHKSHDGGVLGVALDARDTSSLLQQALQADIFKRLSERVFNELGHDLILFEPEDFKVLFVNPRAFRRLGYSHSRLEKLRVVDLLPSVSLEKWAQTMTAAVNEPQKLSAFIVHRSGETTDCEIHCARLREAGHDYGVLLINDVSERAEMARALRQRTSELAASNRDLEQFASAASHDLRAPLRQIANFVSLVLDTNGKRLSQKSRGHLTHVLDRADRMQLMVARLLEYSQIGERHSEREPTDLNNLVAHAIDDLQDRIEETGAQVSVGELPTAPAHAALLQRVFQNLLENALLHGGEGALRIEIAAADEGDLWEVCVADNGRGVPADQAEVIFEMFRRLGDERGPGSGLGLALCRRVLELHGGAIWLDVAYERGARFVMTLPKT